MLIEKRKINYIVIIVMIKYVQIKKQKSHPTQECKQSDATIRKKQNNNILKTLSSHFVT